MPKELKISFRKACRNDDKRDTIQPCRYAAAANRFVLDAELRTNFANNDSTTQFLTGYTYDAQGNRMQSRVWSGTDRTVLPMSIDKFTYDAGGDEEYLQEAL